MRREDSTTFPVLIIPQTFENDDGEYAGIVSIIVDLGTIQTAKRVAAGPEDGLSAQLDRLAGELHISPHTVRNPLKSMFRKLEVSTQAELIERVRNLSATNTEKSP
jgi:DNA-binding CsgD family transcriptional regulator